MAPITNPPLESSASWSSLHEENEIYGVNTHIREIPTYIIKPAYNVCLCAFDLDIFVVNVFDKCITVVVIIVLS